MEKLAHIALWRYGQGQVGAAVLAPRSQSLIDEVKRMFIGEASYDRARDLFLFSPGKITAALSLITRYFSPNVCFICQKLTTPCWYWTERSLVTTTLGSLACAPMPKPATIEGQTRAVIEAAPNALSQLSSASVGLRDALDPSRNAPIGAGSRRRRWSATERLNERDLREAMSLDALPETIAQAPTPAGTIRCTHCGQVIPPGFEKAKDTKKTEDEIYTECQHDFDEEEFCRRCKLKRRVEKNSRFAWLEVD